MNYTRLRLLERQMRVAVALELLEGVRAAPAHRQAAVLRQGLAVLDAPTRAQVYPLLSEDELHLLLPGMTAYVRSRTDDELRALEADERLARRALTTLQRQAQGGHGHAEA